MKADNLFNADFFKSNRDQMREHFSGSAPIVISGNSLIQKSADRPYPFVQDRNFWYLTGCNEPGLLLVMDRDKEYLVTPKRSKTQLLFEGDFDTESLSLESGIETIYDYENGWKHLERRLKKVKHAATIQPSPNYIEALGMFTNPARADLYTKLKDINQDLSFIDLRSVFASLRSVKSDIELEVLKKAVKQTAGLYKHLNRFWRDATNEADLMHEAQLYALKKGTEFGYEPTIASGRNAVTLHYTANNALIDHKKFLLFDVALNAGNYSADITRSVVKSPSKRHAQLYEAVLSVQSFAISLLKPGAIMATYEEAVTQYMGEKLRELGLISTIDKESVRAYYPHSTSHFLGLDVHDVGNYDIPLQPGMVLTVEPGIYIDDEANAVRLEDMILITEDGNENLSERIIKSIDALA